jgi:PAS domain-containing protein
MSKRPLGEKLGQVSNQEIVDITLAIDETAVVSITDFTGKIQYVNDKFCEISKYSREELQEVDHRLINSDIIHQNFSNRCGEQFAVAKFGRAKLETELRTAKSTGWIQPSCQSCKLRESLINMSQFARISLNISKPRKNTLVLAAMLVYIFLQKISTLAVVGLTLTKNYFNPKLTCPDRI